MKLPFNLTSLVTATLLLTTTAVSSTPLPTPPAASAAAANLTLTISTPLDDGNSTLNLIALSPQHHEFCHAHFYKFWYTRWHLENIPDYLDMDELRHIVKRNWATSDYHYDEHDNTVKWNWPVGFGDMYVGWVRQAVWMAGGPWDLRAC